MRSKQLVAIASVTVACLLTHAAASGQENPPAENAQPAAQQEHPDLPPNHSVQAVMVATGMERALGVAINKDHTVYAPNYRLLGGLGGVTAEGAARMICRLDQLAPLEGVTPFGIGIRLDKLQRAIIADGGGGRVLRVDPDGSRADVLADRFEGVKLRAVSHVALDRAGNIYFTESSGKEGSRDGRVFVYQIITGKITMLAGELALPSGLAISPDQSLLYVAERSSRSVTVFKLGPELSERRVLIRFPDETKGEIIGGKFEPLGMACDTKGRLYVAMSKGGVINVVESPTGRLLRQYRTNGEVADCHFDDASLFVAMPGKEAIFRLPLGVEGFKYSQ